MKYKANYKLTREMFKGSEITDEDIFRRIASNMIQKIPISELTKIFNFKKTDPEIEISKWKLSDYNTSMEEMEFIFSLKRSEIILFESEINL